jgi:ribosomal protein S12 methylthiotransferase
MKPSIQKIGFVSLGCLKNLVDSEVMMGQLKQRGYELPPDRQDAYVIVVNTCGFIRSAKKESLNMILEMADLKDSVHLKRFVVACCLVECNRRDLLPEVDAALGASEIEKMVAAVDPAAVQFDNATGLPMTLYSVELVNERIKSG